MSIDESGPAAYADIPDPRALLRRYGIRPRKGLGQHFLVDRRYLGLIVDAADLGPDDVVLEVGPGLGVLTAAIAATARQVVAVEVDPDMCAILADVLVDRTNVDIVNADILEIGIGELLERSSRSDDRSPRTFKVIANLPYYITSAVLRHLLESDEQPELLVVMLQREVADRILAEPGDLSILAVAVQFFAVPRRVMTLPQGAFHPRPKVDSAVLQLTVREGPPVPLPTGGRDQLFRVVKAGFGQKRKQLHNSVSAGLRIESRACKEALRDADVDPSRRAQTLSLDEWSAVARALDSRGLAGP